MLQIDVDDKLQLQAADFIGQRVAVLGTSGNGKSNTVAVLVEELAPLLPMTIVDMESEYYTLRERFDFLVIGKGENVDLEVGLEDAGAIATYALEKGISVILDMLEFSDVERDEFLLAYFQQVWQVALKTRKPLLIVLEECHEFIPQGTRSPLKDIITRIALRGRKRGLGIILASQRTAMVEKNILTQAKMLILHQVDFPTDISVYKSILPQKSAATEEMINDLVIGKAIVRRKGEDGKMKIDVAMMRKRHTQDVGATPGVEVSETIQLRKIDQKLLNDLKRAVYSEVPMPKKVEGAVQLDMTVALESTLVAQKVEIQQMRTRYASLMLSVYMERGGLKKQLAMADERIKTLHAKPVAVGATIPVQKAIAMPELAMAGNETVEHRIVTTTTVETFRSSRSIKIAINRQREAFQTLLGRIEDLSPMHRRILAVMMDSKGTVAIRDLMVKLDYSYERVSNSASQLFKMGLLLKTIPGVYQNYVEAMFRQKYADLPQHELIDELWGIIEE